MRLRKTARTGRWALLVFAALGGGIWLTTTLKPSGAPDTSLREPAGVVDHGPVGPKPEADVSAAEPPVVPAAEVAPDSTRPGARQSSTAELSQTPDAKDGVRQDSARAAELSHAPDSAQAGRRDAAKRESAKPRSKSARKKADCAQPYFIDALGIRRWKRECL